MQDSHAHGKEGFWPCEAIAASCWALGHVDEEKLKEECGGGVAIAHEGSETLLYSHAHAGWSTVFSQGYQRDLPQQVMCGAQPHVSIPRGAAPVHCIFTRVNFPPHHSSAVPVLHLIHHSNDDNSSVIMGNTVLATCCCYLQLLGEDQQFSKLVPKTFITSSGWDSDFREDFAWLELIWPITLFISSIAKRKVTTQTTSLSLWLTLCCPLSQKCCHLEAADKADDLL